MGGIQTTAITYIHLFLSMDWQVDLYLVEHTTGDLLAKIPEGVRIITPTKSLGSGWNRYRSIGESLCNLSWHHKGIRAEAKQNSTTYDLAIAFEGYHNHADLYAAFVQAQTRAIWVHNDFGQKRKNSLKERLLLGSMKQKYPYFNHIICVSKSAKQAFNQLFPEYAEKTQVILNPIPVETIRNRAESTKDPKCITRDGNSFQIIAMGNLIKRKGFDRLIKAFAEVQDKRAILTIVGEGPERENLTQLITDQNLEDRVYLVGQLHNPFPTLKQADLFVMSSHYEGFGMVIAEALALGVPVVTVNISGASDAMQILIGDNSAYGKIVENSIIGLTEAMNFGLQGYFTRGFQIDFQKYHWDIIEKLSCLESLK